MNSPKALSSSRLEIHLLGGLTIFIDGQSLPDSAFKGRKARSLLKLLAHQRQYQIVREHVLDILWPDLEANPANAQLYKALHHIRKTFRESHEGAENWIQITDDLICFTPPGGLVTDLALFEKAARTGLKEKSIAELENAVSLYGGDFLPMEPYVDWTSFPREHYRQLYLDVLCAVAIEYEKQEEFSEAAEMMRLALDNEPTLEVAHQGLMRVFAKKGQSTRAFHQYDVCREILRDELGLGPSPETHKTLDDVQEGKFNEKEEPYPQQTTMYAPATSIIGCTEECETINRQLENLQKGQGAVILITGEAGMGKTRMVQELLQQARQKDLTFFMEGACKGCIAYAPFIALFKDILKKKPDLENMLPVELKLLIPGFSDRELPLFHRDKWAAKGYLFAQIHRFFSKLTLEGPVVIIVEDLHNADQGSKELWSYLIQHRGQLPILFVATLRKETVDPLPGFILNLQNHFAEVIELTPLSYDEHLDLLHLHAENVKVEAAMARHIYQRAEGNPLYTLELLRYYIQDNHTSSPEQPHETELISSSLLSENLPSSISQMIAYKLEKLSPSAHHLLNIAAVIGRKVPYGLLASIWSNGNKNAENGLFNALEEVTHACLLEEHGLDYSFRHALVQETLYSSISEARRQILHKLIAGRLLNLSADPDKAPVELIAWHHLGARDMPEAAKYLMQAGARAENVYAHEDALLRYQEAYNVIRTMEGHQIMNLKYEILERTADIYRSCSRLEESYKIYKEILTVSEDLTLNHVDLMELHRKMAVVAIGSNEVEQAERHLKKAFKLTGDDSRLKARLSITKALYLWHQNQLEEAYQLAKKALRQAKKADANAEASQACETLAMTCLPLGLWEEGLKYEREHQSYGWSAEPVITTDAHHCLGEYHVCGDHPLKKARTFREQVSHQISRLGDLYDFDVRHNRRQAVENLSSSDELHEQVASPAGMAYSLARKSVLYTLLGAREVGWQHIQEGYVYAMQSTAGDHCLQRLYAVGIWNRLEADDLEQAGKWIERSSEKLVARSDACTACTLELYPWFSYYFLQTHQIEKARTCGNAIYDLAEQTGNSIGEAMAFMIQSNICVAEMDWKQAEVYYQKSYQILEKDIPQTIRLPLAHFLQRMKEQQAELS